MSAAILTVYRVVIAAPLPIADADNVVTFSGLVGSGGTAGHFPLRSSLFERFGDESRALEGLAGVDYNAGYPRAFTDGDQSFLLRSGFVTGEFFEVLGATPQLGRPLRSTDDVPGAEPVVVISDKTWRQRFAGDPGAIGQTLTLHDRSISYRIVGVAHRDFDYPVGVDFWAPLMTVTYISEADSTNALIDPVGRLAVGRTRSDLEAEYVTFIAANPDLSAMAGERTDVEVRPLVESVIGDVRPMALALGAGVGLLLLVAVVNVGILLLLRIESHSESVAVRRALGGGPVQTVSQFIGETGWLALSSLGLAVLVCAALLRGLPRLLPDDLPRLASLSDVGVPAGTVVGITVLAFLVAAGLPLFRASVSTASDTRSLNRFVGQPRTGRRLRDILIASEVGLTVVILSGAGLLIRTVQELQSIETGFQADGLTVLELSWPWDEFAQQVVPFFSDLLVAVDGVPGVEAASPIVGAPFGAGWDGRFVAEGQSNEDALSNPWLNMELAGVDYFETFDIAITRGRGFQVGDGAEDPRVAVVSESTAHRLWPGQDPVGKRIGRPPGDSWTTVVGVAEESRQRDLTTERPSIYFPFVQSPGGSPLAFAVGTSLPSEQMIPLLRRTIRDTDSRVVVSRARVMESLMAEPLARPRLAARLLGGLGAAALALAALGIYSVVAASVRMRTRELGVRQALGATSYRISTLVLRSGLTSTVVGVIVGVGVSLMVSSTLRALLYEVQPTDPVALAGSVVALLSVAVAASLIPARDATRVDPVEALRSDESCGNR